MNKSDQIELLAAALVKAQAEMTNPTFDKVNPHLKSQYASLKSVRDTVMPVFTKHGISVVQFARAEADRAGCETVLMHESGQWQSEICMLPVAQTTPQGAGGAITYARRYSLQAIAGVCGETDDDGEASSKKKEGKNKDPNASIKDLTGTAIPATTGAFEGCDEGKQKEIIALAGVINKHFSSGEDLNGYEKYSTFKTAAEKDGYNDHVVALWSLIPSNVRSSIKRLGKAN